MPGPTQLRLASMAAVAYGALAFSSTLHHLQRSGSLRAFLGELSRPTLWLLLVVVAVVAYGLWRRYAWAWWLGVAAACWQVFVIVSAHVHGGGNVRMPSPSTLLALGLLLFMLALLFQPRARAAASR